MYRVSLSVDFVVSVAEESVLPETSDEPGELTPGDVAVVLISGVEPWGGVLKGFSAIGGYKGLKVSASSSNSRTRSPGFKSLIVCAR